MNPNSSSKVPPEQKKFLDKQRILLSYYSKAIKKKLKKIDRLQEQMDTCLKWAALKHKGELIKANFSQIKEESLSLIVWDWEKEEEVSLELIPKQTPAEQMTHCFKMAKKLERGIAPLRTQLEMSNHELADLKKNYQVIQEAQCCSQLEPFARVFDFLSNDSQKKKSLKPQASPYYIKYLSEKGFQIWVGKNAKANDILTFRLANGRDWWLHACGCPGSHIVIRLDKEEQPDEETIKDALQLALYYSKAKKQGECEVLYTQRKYVSKIGKCKAGQVQVSKHKTAFVRLDPVRFEKIKMRFYQE